MRYVDKSKLEVSLVVGNIYHTFNWIELGKQLVKLSETHKNEPRIKNYIGDTLIVNHKNSYLSFTLYKDAIMIDYSPDVSRLLVLNERKDNTFPK